MTLCEHYVASTLNLTYSCILPNRSDVLPVNMRCTRAAVGQYEVACRGVCRGGACSSIAPHVRRFIFGTLRAASLREISVYSLIIRAIWESKG